MDWFWGSLSCAGDKFHSARQTPEDHIWHGLMHQKYAWLKCHVPMVEARPLWVVICRLASWARGEWRAASVPHNCGGRCLASEDQLCTESAQKAFEQRLLCFWVGVQHSQTDPNSSQMHQKATDAPQLSQKCRRAVTGRQAHSSCWQGGDACMLLAPTCQALPSGWTFSGSGHRAASSWMARRLSWRGWWVRHETACIQHCHFWLQSDPSKVHRVCRCQVPKEAAGGGGEVW